MNEMPHQKLRLLSLTNSLMEYRIPVYNLLSESFDLTVAHYGKTINKDRIKFKQILLTKSKRGPFIIIKENVGKIASQFDAVISEGDFHIISFLKLAFIINRKFSLSFWTIGVSASYKKHFDEDRRLDRLRFYLMNKAESIVFYSNYPINRYVNDGGVKRNKLFVANNTVEINHKYEIPRIKKHFLFVGTLYKEKKILDLLEAYLIAYMQDPSIQPLIIIGEGDERERIENWIHEHGLKAKIILKGAIFNQDILRENYLDAIACISPGQAGLTVLNSMAYGVPFITTENAITGGEIFNIINNVNGIIYTESINQLSKILHDLSTDSDKVYNLSVYSQEYYFNKRTMSIMVKGLSDAVMFAYKKKWGLLS